MSAAVQTDELNDCCSAGQGWRRNPRTQPERGPHPERTLSAEPGPEHRKREEEQAVMSQSAFTQICNITAIGPL